jgi:hypothetical protein
VPRPAAPKVPGPRTRNRLPDRNALAADAPPAFPRPRQRPPCSTTRVPARRRCIHRPGTRHRHRYRPQWAIGLALSHHLHQFVLEQPGRGRDKKTPLREAALVAPFFRSTSSSRSGDRASVAQRETTPMRKPSTGQPHAGELHVRFGVGEADAFPTPVVFSTPVWRSTR